MLSVDSGDVPFVRVAYMPEYVFVHIYRRRILLQGCSGVHRQQEGRQK